MDYNIDGLYFECTCGACPEQYDVFKGNVEVAYIRERHGHCRIDMPFGGKTIHSCRGEEMDMELFAKIINHNLEKENEKE